MCPEVADAWAAVWLFQEKERKNAAEEAATGPSRLSSGRLPALITPGAGRVPRVVREPAWGILAGPGPRSRPRTAPRKAVVRPAESGGSPRAHRTPARSGPCLLCRQRAAAKQRAKIPSERPWLLLLRLGRGLMSKPRAPPVRHWRPGRRGAARRGPGCALTWQPLQLLAARLPAPPPPLPPACLVRPDADELVVLWLNQFQRVGKEEETGREGERESERKQLERTHPEVNNSKK